MPMTNPSQQLYGNIKALTARLRESSIEKPNKKNDGIMLRRSMPSASIKDVQGNEEAIKIAKVLMKIEDERNGTA